jgi:hypothetical protein
MPTTVEISGEDVPLEDVRFISLASNDLTIYLDAPAEEELDRGRSETMVPPIKFSAGFYEPETAVHARFLLDHPHRGSLFEVAASAPDVDPDPVEEIPEGHVKLPTGEVIPASEVAGETDDLTPLTGNQMTITTKQDALQVLAEAGADVSEISASNTKAEIIEHAHSEGFSLPNYEE